MIRWDDGMMWWHDGAGWGGWGGWVVMTLVMLAFWSLVVFGLVAMFRGDRGSRPGRPIERSPMQILDERFARGEIDSDEYSARRDTLRSAR